MPDRHVVRHALRPAAAALVLVLALAACTGEDSPSGSASSSSSGSDTPSPLPSGPIEFVPGAFVMEVSGVTAHLDWEESGITLDVHNRNDQTIGEPSIYVVTQDQQQVDGEVAGAAPIEAGDEVSLDVTFPEDLTLDDVGLVILVFGEENFGAMAPEIAT